MMRSILRAATLALLVTMPAAAQEAMPWRLSYFPYLTGSPNDGVMGMARALWFQQADYGARVTNQREVSLEAGYSTRDAWLARADVALPMLADGWRLRARAALSRETNFGLSELPDGITPLARDRREAWVDVTRRLAGPLHLAVRGGLDRQSIEGNVGTLADRYPRTRILPEIGLGDDEVTQTDVTARAALVLDLRDREFDTQSGALLEAGVFTGSAGDGYTGGYALARGWVMPRRGTRLTARAGFRAVGETDAITIVHGIPAWERPLGALGGATSHRALPAHALVGRGLLLAGAEVRHNLLDVGELGAITAVAFVDAGRVFRDPSPLVDPVPGAPIPSGDLDFTLKGWTVGAGGGLAIRVMRAAQLTITAARANDDTRWYVGSGWTW
jgi:hypothetical protein